LSCPLCALHRRRDCVACHCDATLTSCNVSWSITIGDCSNVCVVSMLHGAADPAAEYSMAWTTYTMCGCGGKKLTTVNLVRQPKRVHVKGKNRAGNKHIHSCHSGARLLSLQVHGPTPWKVGFQHSDPITLQASINEVHGSVFTKACGSSQKP